MSEFLLLFRGGDAHSHRETPEKWAAHMQKWMQWMSILQQEGKFMGAQPLQATGKVITGTNAVITDGPFMEGKEMLGGYLICKSESYEEAVAFAKGCPILEYDDGTVEVREIELRHP